VTTTTPGDLTGEVLSAHSGTPDRRLRELLAALIRHLHAFTVETGLTPREWLAGLEFLTATGQKCDSQRQEFILLSDVLGLSSLVDLVNAADGATESTVLGPFYRPGAPRRAMGEHIGRPQDGDPALVRGQVTDAAGTPLAGASRPMATAFTTPRTRTSLRSTCAAFSSPAPTAGMSSEPCGQSVTRFPTTGRWASCSARPDATTGGPPTSTRSSRHPAAGR
jgi:hypothetical protein